MNLDFLLTIQRFRIVGQAINNNLSVFRVEREDEVLQSTRKIV
jgi:hypothetical protein